MVPWTERQEEALRQGVHGGHLVTPPSRLARRQMQWLHREVTIVDSKRQVHNLNSGPWLVGVMHADPRGQLLVPQTCKQHSLWEKVQFRAQ